MKRESPACDHIGIFTSNADRLALFYRDSLGFAVVREEVLPPGIMKLIFGFGGRCRLIKLTSPHAPGTAGTALPVGLEIFEPASGGLRRRLNRAAGYNHWGYRVGDREGFCRSLRKRGVPVIEVRRNSRRVYFIKDPDGNRIEIRT